MKRDKKDLIIKILFIFLLGISLYFIISGFVSKEENQTIYETGINISSPSVSIEVGETKKVDASVVPENATYKKLTWTSADSSVATVDDGNITGITAGSTSISVTTEKMKITRVIPVTVKEPYIKIESINVKESNITLYEGDKYKIEYTITPENATNPNLLISTSDKSIAGLTEEHEIYGNSPGKATITLKGDDITSTIDVTVEKKIIDVTKVELDKKGVILKVGESSKLNATISPSDATDKTIVWESSNKSVATISDGLVKAVGYGDATITAKSNNGITATTQIVVAKEFDSRNAAAKAYLSDSTRNIRNHFYNYKCQNNKDCDRPTLYNSSISGDIKVYLYNASTNKKEYLKTTSDQPILTNLMTPGNTYYLESKDGNSHEYVTISKVLRMIYVKNVRNVRDFGGWKADGGTIKYGIIFRGAEPYESSAAAELMFKLVGITDIVDLRSKSQFNNDKKKLTSFDKHVYPAHAYSINNKDNRLAAEQIMKLVVAGKHIFFHCAVGTDRTGSIAMLLEGILGVNEGNLFDEYELSYFRRQIYNVGRTRTNSSIVKFYNGTAKDGNTTQEKFINWFLSGSTDKEKDLKLINDFRKKMIDGNPTVFKLSNGKLVKE